MEEKVFNAVLMSSTVGIDRKDLFMVWSCYILGNRKFLVGVQGISQRYFEVTYNRNKDSWYVDEYNKLSNRSISNDVLNDYTERNS